MSMTDRIRQKLTKEFAPQLIEVVDESEQHRGHSGYREGGESHFHVKLRAAAFAGKNRVAQQRMVYSVLKDEMAEQIHALALDVAAPE